MEGFGTFRRWGWAVWNRLLGDFGGFNPRSLVSAFLFLLLLQTEPLHLLPPPHGDGLILWNKSQNKSFFSEVVSVSCFPPSDMTVTNAVAYRQRDRCPFLLSHCLLVDQVSLPIGSKERGYFRLSLRCSWRMGLEHSFCPWSGRLSSKKFLASCRNKKKRKHCRTLLLPQSVIIIIIIVIFYLASVRAWKKWSNKHLLVATLFLIGEN